MKLFKKISISLLAMLFTTNLTANNCYTQEECCNTPSSSCYLDNLTFRAEGVYLWAGESDLQYASKNHLVQNEIDNTSATEIQSKHKSPKFSSRLGYRVGLDYLDPCSCIGFGVTYFHFNTNAHGKVSTPAYAALSGRIGSESTFVTPLFGNNVDQQNSFNKCGSKLKLQVNLLDFDFSKTFCYNSCFNFRPLIGVRYADISENYRIRSSGIGSSSERLQDIALNSNTYLKNDFTGFGIHAGFDCDWPLACGFSIYGKAAASILYGRNHRTNSYAYARSDFTNGTISDVEQYIKASQRSPKTIFELGIGVKCNYCICKDQMIGLKLGWEQLVFLNNNRFDNSISGGKNASYVFSRNGDLGLQGLVFGAEYSF